MAIISLPESLFHRVIVNEMGDDEDDADVDSGTPKRKSTLLILTEEQDSDEVRKIKKAESRTPWLKVAALFGVLILLVVQQMLVGGT